MPEIQNLILPIGASKAEIKKAAAKKAGLDFSRVKTFLITKESIDARRL